MNGKGMFLRSIRKEFGRYGEKWLAVGGLCVWMLVVPLVASSFVLQGLAKGDKVSDIAMAGISGEGGKLSSFAGEKGLVVIYWTTWSSRSPGLLSFAERELTRYESRGLKFLAVNADHPVMTSKEIAAVKSKAAELSLSFPVVLDARLRGFHEIGILSVPTTLILRPDLTLADAYPGFLSEARNELPDRLDDFLGIRKKRQVEKKKDAPAPADPAVLPPVPPSGTPPHTASSPGSPAAEPAATQVPIDNSSAAPGTPTSPGPPPRSIPSPS